MNLYHILTAAVLLTACNEQPSQLEQIKEDRALEKYKEQRLKEITTKVADDAVKTLDSCPLKITRTTILSTNNLQLTIQNPTSIAADGIKVGYFLFNNFDEPVGGFGNNTGAGIVQQTLRPGDSQDYLWGIEDYEGATKAKAYIQSVHFTDGTLWEKPNK